MLAALVLMLLGGEARAGLLTVFVNSGKNIVRLLIEKRTDLTVHLLGAAMYDGAAEGAKGLYKVIANDSTCSVQDAKVATCSGEGPAPGSQLPPPKPLTPDRVVDKQEIDKTGAVILQQLIFAQAIAAPLAPQPAPARRDVPSLDPKELEVAFWWSIQSSTFAADFEDYLAKYQDGEFRSLAERRLSALRGHETRRASGCPDSSEPSILDPIHRLFAAINRRDIDLYAAQWADGAVYRSFDGRIVRDKDQQIVARRKAFALWKDAEISLLQWRVSAKETGTAVVRDLYTMRVAYPSGKTIVERDQLESYKLVCGGAGSGWKILENVDYVP
jgi:hypothetical protein